VASYTEAGCEPTYSQAVGSVPVTALRRCRRVACRPFPLFTRVRGIGILRTSLSEVATWHTKIRQIAYIPFCAPALQSDQSSSRASSETPPPQRDQPGLSLTSVPEVLGRVDQGYAELRHNGVLRSSHRPLYATLGLHSAKRFRLSESANRRKVLVSMQRGSMQVCMSLENERGVCAK